MDVREKLVEIIIKSGEICYSQTAEELASYLIAHGVTVKEWIPASEPPKEYRDEYGEFILFLVCEYGVEYPFRAMYDGKVWNDGFYVIPVTHWMPLPQLPKGNNYE